MKRLSFWLTAGCLSVALSTASCSDNPSEPEIPATPEEKPVPEPEPEPEVKWTDLTAAPGNWDGTKRAGMTYQLLVYSFADSNGDGTGDFQGIIDKLDYLQSLGISALWLSPIHPAMSYHGYDVTDYTAVNPAFGTMADFQRLIEEAHKRDIRIYLDYVMNHTGTDHPWFRQALSAADSPYRDYFLFSTNPAADIAVGRLPMMGAEGTAAYNAAQWIAAKGTDTLQPLYYHSHFATSWFADLNYGPVEQAASSPAYQAMADAAKSWIDRGVDGLRLDAVKHIYHNERSDENPRFLKTFYEDMDSYFRQQGKTEPFYMVGEVLSEADQVAPYYAGLPVLFEFSFWYRLEWAVNHQQGRYFAKDLLGYRQQYAACRTDYTAATKLSNHDEDRTASKLGKSAAKEKLAAAVLLTADGSPYIYYGEELGLYGTKEKGDEYVRGPMLWGDGTETHYTDKTDTSVAATLADAARQQADTSSLLNTYIAFARLRNTYPALAEGKMERHPVYNESNGDFASLAVWYRSTTAQRCLVIHNFGKKEVTLPLTDAVEKALIVQGNVQQKTEAAGSQLKMGACASVVFLLK